jgi:rare lipoprotein A (peptidoglycan hydrolase)
MTITTKRATSAAIHDVLERAGSLHDAPARPPLTLRLARLMRTCRRRRPTRRALLTVAALAAAPALVPADASAEEFRPALASEYGAGLIGNPLACGGLLWQGTIGVAHKTMRCGQRLRICVRRCVTVRVIDRGPYVGAREFDLTTATARRVGFRGVGTVFVRRVWKDA